MNAPSPRQLEVLREISEHQKSKGYPITIRELCDVMEIRSTNGIAQHITLLEKKGLVRREPRRSRTLQLTNAGTREIAEGAK